MDLTNKIVGLFSKKVKVVEAEVKAVDSKELLGWGLEVLAVAGISFALFAALCIVTLLQLTTGGVFYAPFFMRVVNFFRPRVGMLQSSQETARGSRRRTAGLHLISFLNLGFL